ncbi:sigma-54 interaction domain-containing protein [Desulfonatronovibrio hydrogenovorans]|uniref:sigma-54 interaction domain-containing protein n=1 Tax=Desulfonatronovibrio hydrogenovorans TaxID=53245 RepID=UPI001377825B|nr:sigma-54 dependent transcriptional regulator [Desulfonatronovibrio hydrogenovorans]
MLTQTSSPAMQEVFQKANLVAPTSTTVLLTGETGVGKSSLARYIHNRSTRKDHPFAAINCGAIPENLIESELFGHEKGAFTGAINRKAGKFELADQGTVFLDEVGSLSQNAQVKLLSFMQDRTFQRVGGTKDIHVQVRIIAATNADLKSLGQQDKFRQDLMYRLNVFPIEIPPLRERTQDIPAIARDIFVRLKPGFPGPVQEISREVIQAFMDYSWPGNVRELENLIERAFILESSELLTPMSFPPELFVHQAGNETEYINIDLPLSEVRRIHLEAIEKQYLQQLLIKNKGRIRNAARQAGIGERQLNKLMGKYGLKTREFKPCSAQNIDN